MITEFTSLVSMLDAIPNEQAAIDYFRSVRWKLGEFCPHCGHDKLYHFTDKRTFKCAQCRARFSIRVGTIFEDTKIEIRKWLAAIWLITSHRKGIASTQLARDLHVTQKTAWFMLHRLRHAARTRSFNRPLRGMVEVDEAFFGGKDENKHKGKRGKRDKVVVVGLLERGGELRAKPIKRMQHAVREVIFQVDPGSHVMTDEWPGYNQLNKDFNHHTVNHKSGEYVKNFFKHVNGIEGVWSLLKRQIYGIHHFVSPKHLARYVDEAVWRYNRRAVRDAGRIAEFLTRVDGRLTYNVLVANA
jgi:transposase-like protein